MNEIVDQLHAPFVTTEELAEIGREMPEWKLRVARLFFTDKDRLRFYRAFAVYQGQSVREDVALTNWWNVITQRGLKGINSSMAIIIPVLLYRMNTDGERWAKAFAPWLPAQDAMIFRATQENGVTAEVLRRLIKMTELARHRSREIGKALGPAGASLLIMLVMIFAAGLIYFPMLKQAIPGLKITGGLEQLQNLSDFLMNWGVFIVPVLISLPFLAKRFFESSGGFRNFCDSLWGFRLYRQYTGMLFLFGLSENLKTGARFEEAVRLMLGDAVPYVQERLAALLAYDDLLPADAMMATGFNWPDEQTIELLQLYMGMKNPHEGIDVLVEEWFDEAIDKYTALAKRVSMLAQFFVWGVALWLYVVTNSAAHGIVPHSRFH